MESGNDLEEIKATVKELKELNLSLMNEVRALKAQIPSSTRQNNPQGKQQEQEQLQSKKEPLPEFTFVKPNKYADATFLTTQERREIQFEMASNTMNCYRFDNLEPARFYNFCRKGEEEIKKPDPDDGLTSIKLGIFTTPIAGRYRFDVGARMHGSGKAEWYICCVRKEDALELDGSDSDSDDDYDSDDEKQAEIKQKKKEAEQERERILNERTRRRLIFSYDTEAEDHYRNKCREASVGIDCEKDVCVWTQVIVLEGNFNRYECVCTFGGRLVC